MPGSAASTVLRAGSAAVVLVGLLLPVSVTAAGAATTAVSAPRIVYTHVEELVEFAGTDPVSGEARTISVALTVSSGCDPTSENGWTTSGCGRVSLTLADTSGGSLQLSEQSSQIVTAAGTRYRTSGGAIAEGPTDPWVNGGPVFSLTLRGTSEQLNDTLAHLWYLPAAGFEDATFDESTGSGTGTPLLRISADDGSAEATESTASTVLRVEGINGSPEIAGPVAPLLVAADSMTSWPATVPNPALISVIDPELCLGDPGNRCDGAYADGPLVPEPDDAMLLLLRIDEPGCGRFALRGGVFELLGGVALPSPAALLTDPDGLGLEQDAADAILASLGTAATVDLSAQAGGPTALTTVFAGVAGSIAEVRYALSQVTYEAPAGDADCRLRVSFSDLGNNGMPTAWVATPAHEIPDARTAHGSYQILVDQGAPQVAIDQATTQEDPSSSDVVEFDAVFSEPVTGFRADDVLLSGTAGATLATVTGGPTSFTVRVSGMTASGTIEATIPAGAARDATDNPSAASTSADNAVTWQAPVASSADVSVALSGPSSVKSGRDGTYRATVANSGPDTASAVSVRVALPAGTGFVAVQARGWVCDTPAPGDAGLVSCAWAAPLAAGASASQVRVTTTLPAAAGPTVTVTAEVSSAVPDPDPIDNVDAQVTRVR